KPRRPARTMATSHPEPIRHSLPKDSASYDRNAPARSLCPLARRGAGASADALPSDETDRARPDPGGVDRRDRRTDQHDEPGGQGGVRVALADPFELRDQGLRAGRVGTVCDHAWPDDA